MTDSGGIQEEAAAMHVPVLVLRDTTERQEIIEAGAGILVGTKKDHILRQVESLERHPEKYKAMKNARNPYGDGTTAAQICAHLIEEDALEKQYA